MFTLFAAAPRLPPSLRWELWHVHDGVYWMIVCCSHMTPMLQDDEYVVYSPDQVRLKYVVQFSVEGDQLKEFNPTVSTSAEPLLPPVQGENRSLFILLGVLVCEGSNSLKPNVCLPVSRAAFGGRRGRKEPSGGRKGRAVGQLRPAGPSAGRPCEVQADGFALSGRDASLLLIRLLIVGFVHCICQQRLAHGVCR